MSERPIDPIAIDVGEVLQRSVTSLYSSLVTRPTGRAVRMAIETQLHGAGTLSLSLIDFSEVVIIDFSCADEFLAKLLTRLTAGEYGDKYLRLSGVNPSQKENLEVALERKKLATIFEAGSGEWHCLGSLKPYLRETLAIVMDRSVMSARGLSELLEIELNNSSTRLINLHRQRLVTRRERFMPEGGREFMYAGLKESPPEDDGGVEGG